VTIRINKRSCIFELDMRDEDLIATMLSSLDPFIKEGYPIRIIQSSIQALSKSQSLFSRILRTSRELMELADDVRKLIRTQRARF
jgi:5-methylcytosine-specific restriction endonuclease McrBC regulatory subunit McrC